MALRFYFKFKTFLNHTCRVDIYDKYYSGSAVELKKDIVNSPGCPADNPLIIEEDNSDNLLDNVRVKTGYINLVELIDGGLRPLFPEKNDDMEMYVLMDIPDNISSDSADADPYITLHGYIQAQSFENDYFSYKKEQKIPFMSTMEMIGDLPMPVTSPALDSIFDDCFSDYYKYLVFPDIQYRRGEEYVNQNILSLLVAEPIFYPYNQNYNYGLIEDGITPSVYSPVTYKDFVKMLCDSFGLISHDYGNMLVFTKIGYIGNYIKYEIDESLTSGVVIGNGNNGINMNQFFFANNTNRKSYNSPVRNLTMNWNEYTYPYIIDFNASKYVSGNDSGVGDTVLSYQGRDISSNIWVRQAVITLNGLQMIGKDDGNVVLRLRSSAANLFSCTFFAPRGNVTSLDIEVDEGYNQSAITLISVGSGSKWWNFHRGEEGWPDDEWITTENTTQLVWANNKCSVAIGSNDISLTVYFKSGNNALQSYDFKNISINYNPRRNLYNSIPLTKSKRVVPLDPTSLRDEDININIQSYTYANWQFDMNDFRYLGISQRNLIMNLRPTAGSNIDELQLLLSKFVIPDDSEINRVISCKYDIRKDIYTLQIMGNQYF